jgi:hypothetical protein
MCIQDINEWVEHICERALRKNNLPTEDMRGER